MSDQALVSMAEQFSGLPIKSLIGAPLMAAVEANSRMAITQTQFLLSTCFTMQESTDSEGNPYVAYDPIMISLKVTRPVIDAEGKSANPVTSTIELPLLTILPLNSLGVDDVKIHFEMEVKSSFSDDKQTAAESESSASGSFSAKAGIGWFSAEVSGSVSSSSKSSSSEKSHYEKSNSARYEIDVHAGQLPLPEGVTTIIQAFSQSIAPIQLKPSK